MRKYLFVILMVLLAGGRLVAQRPSDEISVANYNDNEHGKKFVGVDPTMKRFGVVLTNHSDRPVNVAHITWKWIDANGKPGELTQEHNSFVTLGGPVVGPQSSVLILPNATSMQAGQSGFTGGYLHLPAGMATASTVTMSVDDVLLADGQVIGPEGDRLVTDLKGQAEAARLAKDIIQAAKAGGGDPRQDLLKAAVDRSLAPATRTHLTHRAYGQIGDNPRQIQLPNFYRK